MKNVLLFQAASLFVLFVSTSAVFAEEIMQPREGQLRMEERMKAREDRMEEREDTKNTRMMKEQKDREEHYQEMRARFEARRDDILIRQEEARDSLKVRHQELSQQWHDRKANLSERRKQNIKSHIERIIERMNQAVDRLTDMADKIEYRVSRAEEHTGANADTLRSLLQEARSAIARADTMLDTVAVELRAAPDTANPADALGKAREELEQVKAALREAHAALVEIVVEMKKGQRTSSYTNGNE